MPTAAQATPAINFSLRRRRPMNQLIAAPASGAKMIRLRELLSIRARSVRYADSRLVSLKFQYARLIHIQSFAVAENGDDDSQAHRCFSGSHSHHDKNKEL